MLFRDHCCDINVSAYLLGLLFVLGFYLFSFQQRLLSSHHGGSKPLESNYLEEKGLPLCVKKHILYGFKTFCKLTLVWIIKTTWENCWSGLLFTVPLFIMFGLLVSSVHGSSKWQHPSPTLMLSFWAYRLKSCLRGFCQIPGLLLLVVHTFVSCNVFWPAPERHLQWELTVNSSVLVLTAFHNCLIFWLLSCSYCSSVLTTSPPPRPPPNTKTPQN